MLLLGISAVGPAMERHHPKESLDLGGCLARDVSGLRAGEFCRELEVQRVIGDTKSDSSPSISSRQGSAMRAA